MNEPDEIKEIRERLKEGAYLFAGYDYYINSGPDIETLLRRMDAATSLVEQMWEEYQGKDLPSSELLRDVAEFLCEEFKEYQGL